MVTQFHGGDEGQDAISVEAQLKESGVRIPPGSPTPPDLVSVLFFYNR